MLKKYQKPKFSFVKIFISLLILFTINCRSSKPSTTMIPWMAALMGGTSSPAVSSSNIDSNGETLPEKAQTPAMEIPSKGSAVITGAINPSQCFDNGIPIPCSNDPGLDITLIKVQLVSADGKVLATTNLSQTGEYKFSISELNNGNYRVLINTANGLNYAFTDFKFTFNPTLSSNNVAVNTIIANRYYLSSGSAQISGVIKTPGFTDQNGSTIIANGPLSGVKIVLLDSFNQLISQTFTDSSGKYEFNSYQFANGNYKVIARGSELSTAGRYFTDETMNFRFTFSGNDAAITTKVELGSMGIQFVPAKTAPLNLSEWSIFNAANTGLDLANFQVILKDTQNSTISTTTTNSSGKFSFSPTLENGIYTIEIKKTGFYDSVSSFSFIPNYQGNSTSVVQTKPIILIPKPSNITGKVSGPSGIPSRIEGSSINFRPSSNQPPSSLSYLTQGTDDRLKNLANLWIREACATLPSCSSACAAGGFQSSCVSSNQGSGPWTYISYQNKVYEIKPDNETVFFTAVAGKWEYYISAPGYNNTPIQNITLNGGDVNVSTFNLTPSEHRGAIKGQTVVFDTLSTGPKNSYGGSATGYTQYPGLIGLFAILLGNTTSNSQPLAHITLTGQNGQYSFDGNSKVVPLPTLTTLCSNVALTQSIGATGVLTESSNPSCSSVGDSLRVAYTISMYSSTDTKYLSNSPVVGSDIVSSSIYVHDGKYTFRQGSYSIIFVDPIKHLSSSSQKAEINTTLVPSFGDFLSLTSNILHLPRKTISGTLNDAITTLPISGAVVSVGVDLDPDPNIINFSQTATRDQDIIPTDKPRLLGSQRSDIPVPDVTTSANGSYSIPNLNPGNYVLRITKEGYEEIFISVNVSSNNNTTVANAQVVQSGARGDLSGRVILAGGSNFTNSYNLELVHPTSGMRPTSPVTPNSLTTGVTNFSNSPTYQIYKINSGQWKLKFSSAGYVPVEGLVNIQGGVMTNFDIITMIPGTQAPANISGILYNAFNNLKITTPLTISIRPGINNKNGPYALNGSNETILPIQSGSDGSYMVPNVPAGNYTLEVMGNGYSTTYQTVISAGTGSSNQNVFVSPSLDSTEVRIVLSWGSTPRDLDSHLEYGNSTCLDGAKKCQVVWNQTNRLNGDLTLDVDVTTGYGPETITVKGTTWSKPRRGYSVYNWSNETGTSIFTSGAVVKVFKSSGLVRTFNPGLGQTGRWWQIFCLDTIGKIIDVGQTGCDASEFFNAPQN